MEDVSHLGIGDGGERSINTQCVPACDCSCVIAGLQGSKLKLGGNELENKGAERGAVRLAPFVTTNVEGKLWNTSDCLRQRPEKEPGY